MPKTARVNPPPPAIDLSHLRSQTGNDQDLAAELLDLFARQARAILQDLTAPAAGAARTSRADLLHTLCGSARAVGAWDVASGAEGLEREERAAAGVDARRFAALGRSVGEACEAIDAMRGGADADPAARR